jgi:hypothetical protein
MSVALWLIPHNDKFVFPFVRFEVFRAVCSEDGLMQGCTNPRCQVARETKFCTVAPNTYESSAWNLFHITHLAPRILRWPLDCFEKL